MKEVLYYQGKNAFCLLVDEVTRQAVARGVSICSPKDQFEKKVGRAKARGRAQQAIARKGNVDSILFKQKLETFTDTDDFEIIDYYATYQPFETTMNEKSLVEKALAPKTPKA